MKDFDVWFKGMIIANVQAVDKSAATKKARKLYTGGTAITVTECSRR